MLVKARTAIEGLSGSVRAGLGGSTGVSPSSVRPGPCSSCTLPTNRKPLRGSVLMRRCSSTVADCRPGSVNAGGQRRIRYDPPIPDGGDEVVLARDALAVLDQILQEIEDLRSKRNQISAP